MSDGERKEPIKSVWGKLRDMAPYGILIVLFMAGFTIASSQWSAASKNLESELDASRTKVVQLTAELAQLTSEYNALRKSTNSENFSQSFATGGESSQIIVSPKSTNTPFPSIGPALETTNIEQVSGFAGRKDTESKTISTESTGSFFNGELFVSLVGLVMQVYRQNV